MNTTKKIFSAIKNGKTVKHKNLHSTKTLKYRDSDGNSILHTVSDYGTSKQLSSILRKNKTILEATNNQGETALHVAVSAQDYLKVECLLKSGLSPNTANKQGLTPLHYACAFDESNIVELLLMYGADPNLTDEQNTTPLHVAVSHRAVYPLTPLLNNRKTLLNIPLKESLDTPLHLACRGSHAEAITQLVVQGGDVNAPNANGETPLSIAVSKKADMMVCIMLSARYGGDPNIGLFVETMPLYIACELKDLKTTYQLLLHGANPEYVLTNPSFIAFLSHHSLNQQISMSDLIKLNKLLNNNPEYFKNIFPSLLSNLGRFVKANSLNGVQLLLAHGVDPNQFLPKEEDDKPLLYMAVERGLYLIAQALLEAGANVNEQFDGHTALMKAVAAANFDMVKLLLRHGANVNIQTDRNEFSALHIAARLRKHPNNIFKITLQLLIAGIDPLLKAKDGKTAAEYVRDPQRNFSKQLMASWIASQPIVPDLRLLSLRVIAQNPQLPRNNIPTTFFQLNHDEQPLQRLINQFEKNPVPDEVTHWVIQESLQKIQDNNELWLPHDVDEKNYPRANEQSYGIFAPNEATREKFISTENHKPDEPVVMVGSSASTSARTNAR